MAVSRQSYGATTGTHENVTVLDQQEPCRRPERAEPGPVWSPIVVNVAGELSAATYEKSDLFSVRQDLYGYRVRRYRATRFSPQPWDG
jgi:hypothetical protein